MAGDRRGTIRNAERYTQDVYRWTQKQVALLREGKWHELDCEHLMEEIADLGRSARKEFRSYLEGLVLHLLQWRYQPDYQTRSGRDAIVENRARIPDCLTESPSLHPQLPTLLQECYPHAQRKAARQTRLPLATFPETCPWTVEQILNAAFWPDAQPCSSCSREPDTVEVVVQGGVDGVALHLQDC